MLAERVEERNGPHRFSRYTLNEYIVQMLTQVLGTVKLYLYCTYVSVFLFYMKNLIQFVVLKA